MTEAFLNLVHSGAVNAQHFTNKDRRALLQLVKESLLSDYVLTDLDQVDTSVREPA
jgi:hypothetical protein